MLIITEYMIFGQKPLPADNLIKYEKKTYSEKQHLVNSRFELLKTRQ